MLVQLHQITLSRAQLDAIPEADRRLLVLVAHAANELSVLSKLFHFSASSTSAAPILQEAENAQAMVLARVLTGKIYECWGLLQSAFFGTALSKTYEPQFDAGSSDALMALKRYFSRDNAIATVRNQHAFHYATDQIDAGYKALADGDSLEMYLASSTTNTLYAFADTIAGRAMLESVKADDPKGAFEVLISETTKAVTWINTVVASLMAICFKTHLGGGMYAAGAKVVEIEGAPDSQQISIPYFIEIEGEEGPD